MDNIYNVWKAGGVNRWHHSDSFALRNSQDTNWGHQCRTATLMYLLFPDSSSSAIMYALTHDNPEKLTGDISGPTKRADAEIDLHLKGLEEQWQIDHDTNFSLSKREYMGFQLCDKLDAILWMLTVAPSLRKRLDWRRQVQDIKGAADTLNVGYFVTALLKEAGA